MAVTGLSAEKHLTFHFPPAHISGLSVSCFAFLCFFFNYFSDGMRPGADYRLGWYGSWFDQSKYYDMIMSLPKGTLGEFRYPPVYPLLGVFGQMFYHSDPFFLVDLILFITYIYFAHRVFARFLSPTSAIIAACVLTQISVDMFVTPWTSTVAAAGMVVLLDCFTARRYTLGAGLLAGIAAGFVFGSRIGDALPAGIIMISVFLDRRTPPQERYRFLAGVLLAAGVVVAVVVGINLKYDGRVFGSYFSAIMSQGFNFIALPVKLYGYFIDPYIYHGESHYMSRAVLFRLPFLLLAPLGLILMVRAEPKSNAKAAATPFLLGIVGWFVLYAPFIAVTALTLRQGSQHYTKPLLPLLVGASFYALAAIPEPPMTRRLSGKLLGWYAIGVCVCLFGMRLVQFGKLDLSQAVLSSDFNPGLLAKAVDGKPETRWDCGALQRPGIEFAIDLRKSTIVQRIVLDTGKSPNDYPRKLSIWQSLDGQNWYSWWATNQSSNPLRSDYRSDPRRVRWLKFRLEDSDPHYYWSVHELELYGW